MEVFAYTDTGVSREENQDAYYYCQGEVSLYMVADGMGGHRDGEFASNLTAYTIENCFDEHYEELAAGKLPIPKFINQAVQKANSEIFSFSKKDIEDGGTMGTTAVILVTKGDRAYIGHVGDSRAYLVRDGELQKLTTDHSLVEMLIRSGSITEEEAKTHPQRNIITRAVGTNEKIEVDIKSFDLKKGDIVFLTSDGLHGVLSEDYIIDKINETPEDLDGVCKDLIYEANELGGPDNITILMTKKS